MNNEDFISIINISDTKLPEYTEEEKIEMLLNNKVIIRRRILNTILNNINNRYECAPELLIDLIKLYRENNIDIKINEIISLFNYYPELICIYDVNDNIVFTKDIITKCTLDDNKYMYLITYPNISNNLKELILDIFYKIDKNYYMEALLEFNKNTIINLSEEMMNILNNPKLLNKILDNYNIEPDIICNLR